MAYWTWCQNEKKGFSLDHGVVNAVTNEKKKNVFTLGHGVVNVVTKWFFFSFDHDVLNVAKKMKNKKFSWSWHGDGSRRRGIVEKWKWWK